MAEHLRPNRSEELVDKLTSLARRWIYFSAAPPGQGGRGHINCRPMTEWTRWFEAQGWRLDEGRTATLALTTKRLDKAVCLHGNSVIFKKHRLALDIRTAAESAEATSSANAGR